MDQIPHRRLQNLKKSLFEFLKRDYERAVILPFLLNILSSVWRRVTSGGIGEYAATGARRERKALELHTGVSRRRQFNLLSFPDKRRHLWLRRLKNNLSQLKENLKGVVALGFFLGSGISVWAVLAGFWKIPASWQRDIDSLLLPAISKDLDQLWQLLVKRLRDDISIDVIAVFLIAVFCQVVLPRLVTLIRGMATVAVNLISMCFSILAAISFGWMDDEGQIPFAVQWFLIAAEKRDSADLLADLEDLYPTWAAQRGPIKAAWLCYAKLFSYYGHRLVAKLSSPRRRSAK